MLIEHSRTQVKEDLNCFADLIANTLACVITGKTIMQHLSKVDYIQCVLSMMSEYYYNMCSCVHTNILFFVPKQCQKYNIIMINFKCCMGLVSLAPCLGIQVIMFLIALVFIKCTLCFGSSDQ